MTFPPAITKRSHNLAPPRALTVLAVLLVPFSASARDLEEPDETRPWVPASSVAAEEGAGLLWVNPALGPYDTDLRWTVQGAFYAAGSDPTALPATNDLSLALGAQGAGLGLRVLGPLDGTGSERVALSYSTGLALGAGLAAGLHVNWQLPSQSTTGAVLADIGLAWRKGPLGVGVVAHDLGALSGGLGDPRLQAGVAFHPGRGLTAALDGWYASTYGGQLSLRVRPTSGVYLRGAAQIDSVSGFGITAGLEIAWGGVGASLSGAGGDQLTSGAGFGGVVGQLAVSSAERDDSVLSAKSQVALGLEGPPAEHPQTPLLGSAEQSWLELMSRLEDLEANPRVQALTVRLDPAMGWSWARCTELRDRLVALSADKDVTVYLHGNASTRLYYVATAADQVLLHPAGQLDLIGSAAELTYIAGTLDLVGAEAQFVRRSEYKSAVEQYTSTEPSEPALEQLDALLDHQHQRLLAAVSEARGVAPGQVEQWIDTGPFTPDQALAAGLVDALVYPDALEEHVDPDKRLVDLEWSDLGEPDLPWRPRPRVAVIHISGIINSGRSTNGGLLGLMPQTAGSDTLAKQLARAAEDDRIKAVVLRVDSPGGSAFASEEIWRSVRLVQQEGKPVVVSMAGVAASGGYYVAAPADAIWAEPDTITGSIGVFAGKVATGGVLEQLGVSSETVKRGRNANLYSPTEPWDPAQLAQMQALVDDMYTRFKLRVGEGRSLTPEQVEEVARGRVWTGSAAKEVGLVDELGGVLDAIADASGRAGIEGKVDVVSFGLPVDPLGSLVSSATGALVPGGDRAAAALLPRMAPALRLPASADPLLAWGLTPGTHVWMMAPYTVEAR